MRRTSNLRSSLKRASKQTNSAATGVLAWTGREIWTVLRPVAILAGLATAYSAGLLFLLPDYITAIAGISFVSEQIAITAAAIFVSSTLASLAWFLFTLDFSNDERPDFFYPVEFTFEQIARVTNFAVLILPFPPIAWLFGFQGLVGIALFAVIPCFTLIVFAGAQSNFRREFNKYFYGAFKKESRRDSLAWFFSLRGFYSELRGGLLTSPGLLGVAISGVLSAVFLGMLRVESLTNSSPVLVEFPNGDTITGAVIHYVGDGLVIYSENRFVFIKSESYKAGSAVN